MNSDIKIRVQNNTINELGRDIERHEKLANEMYKYLTQLAEDYVHVNTDDFDKFFIGSHVSLPPEDKSILY